MRQSRHGRDAVFDNHQLLLLVVVAVDKDGLLRNCCNRMNSTAFNGYTGVRLEL